MAKIIDKKGYFYLFVLLFIPLLFTVFFFPKVWFSKEYFGELAYNFYFEDTYSLWYPYEEYIKSIGIPVYSPYIEGGRIFITFPHSLMFYPFGFVFRILDFFTALKVYLVIHLIIALLGMFFFLRSIGFRRFSPVLGAWVYTFSGYYTFIFYIKHISHLAFISLIPVFFLFGIKSLRRGSLLTLLGFSLSVSLLILTGDFQGFFYSMIVFLILTFYLGRSVFQVFKVFVFLVIGFLMAGVQLFPTLYDINKYLISLPRAKDFVFSLSIPLVSFLYSMFPYPYKVSFFAKWVKEQRDLLFFVINNLLYLGLSGIFFSLNAKRYIRLSLMFIIPAFILMLGKYAPWEGLVYKIPLLNSFRGIGRITFLFFFGVSILVSSGFWELRKGNIRIGSVVFILIAGIMFVLLYEFGSVSLLIFLLSISISIVFFKKQFRYTAVLGLILFLIESGYNRIVWTDRLGKLDLKLHILPYEIKSVGVRNRVMFFNCIFPYTSRYINTLYALRYRIPIPDGVYSLSYKDYAEFLDYLVPGVIERDGKGNFIRYRYYKFSDVKLLVNKNFDLLARILGIRYFVIERDCYKTNKEWIDRLDGFEKKKYGGIVFLEYKNYNKVVFGTSNIYGRYFSFKDVLKDIKSNLDSVSLKKIIYKHGGVCGNNGYFSILFENRKPLVLNISYGFHDSFLDGAKLDGKRIKLYKTFGAFMGIKVDSIGEHKLVLSLRFPPVCYSFYISLFAALIFIGVFVFVWKNR